MTRYFIRSKYQLTVNTTETRPALRIVCESQKHPFHILDASPFPFLASMFLLSLLTPVTFYMHGLELPLGLPRADMVFYPQAFGLFFTARRTVQFASSRAFSTGPDSSEPKPVVSETPARVRPPLGFYIGVFVTILLAFSAGYLPADVTRQWLYALSTLAGTLDLLTRLCYYLRKVCAERSLQSSAPVPQNNNTKQSGAAWFLALSSSIDTSWLAYWPYFFSGGPF